jgi:hypothetical protein
MATKIIHKKSSVAGKLPLATDLEVGEIALNLADALIYTKQTDGTIIELSPSEPTTITSFGAWTLGDSDADTWTIAESGGNIIFTSEGTVLVSVDAQGNFQADGNVNSNQTVGGTTDTTVASGEWIYHTETAGFYIQYGSTNLFHIEPDGDVNIAGDLYTQATLPESAGSYFWSVGGVKRVEITTGGDVYVDASIDTNATITIGGGSDYDNTDVDAHFNTSSATTGQVLSWDGSDYDWVDQSSGGGGGASNLNGLSDVATLNLQNNDLLMYNSTASEWQNTNLGISIAPTVALQSADYFGGNLGEITISNHNTYDDPAYFVEIYNGATLLMGNDDFTKNTDGTITFTVPSNPGTYSLKIKTQDFGDLQSEVTTTSITFANFGGTYRYWRLKTTGSHTLVAHFHLFSGAGQTGTNYSNNMTSDVLPSPKVASSSMNFGGYESFKAFDNNVNTHWWNLTTTNSSDHVQIDLGTATAVNSLLVRTAGFVGTEIFIYGSNSGAFTGEEVQIYNTGTLTTNTTYNGG